MNEEEMRELFREMREEPVPADSLARVRMRLGERVAKKRWWRIPAAALASAACILAAFFLLRPAKTPVPIEKPVISEIAPVQPPVEVPVRAVPRPRRARPRPVVEPVPVSIRIETPDPDVVILLVN